MDKKRGILIQLIALLARIPLTRIIGDEGNGIYAAAFEFYTILLILSVWCMPETLAKMIHARLNREQYKNAKHAFRTTFIWNLLISIIICCIMIFTSDYIASYFLMVPMSSLTIKMLGPSVILAGFVATLRGYFQGMGTYMPTVVSTGTEQIVTAVASIIASMFFCNYGIKVAHLLHNNSFAAAYAVMGIGFGNLIGLFFAFLFLIFVKLVFKQQERRLIDKDITRGNESNGDILRSMMYILLPLILTTCIYHVGFLIDQILYNGVMTMSGNASKQVINFGIYAGKYKVLMDIPIVIASVVWLPLINALEKSYQRVDMKLIHNKMMSVYRISLIIIMPFATAYLLLARPILNLLFKGDITLSAQLLIYGSAFLIFYTIAMIGNSILQGIGKTKLVNINAALALGLHIIVLMLLLKNLKLDIFAICYANIVMAIFMCIFNYIFIKKYTRFEPEWLKMVVLPFVFSFIASALAKAIYAILNRTIGSNAALIIGLLISFIAYIIVITAMHLLSEKELKIVPGGSVIRKILKVVHLIP